MKTKLLTIVLAFVGCTLALAQDEVTENGYGDFLRAVFMNNRFYDEVLSIGDHGYFDGVKAYDKDKYT